MAFGLIATMLLVAGFPIFVIFFFGIFAYFLWKTFSQPSRSGTREIFEFYLAANEILRDDERRWFGFEVQEVIGRGERILQMINGAPPLVYFTLGALYHQIGDHKSAVNHLAYVVENENSSEQTYVYPSPELRYYVKILRKIEREPAEAPQTSAAIRALERARRNRGRTFLENSRDGLKLLGEKKQAAMAEQKKQIDQLAEINAESIAPRGIFQSSIVDELSAIPESDGQAFAETRHNQNGNKDNSRNEKNGNSNAEIPAGRQSISEVLYDIYDKK